MRDASRASVHLHAALTVEQVNAAIKRHLRPESLVKITAGDKKKM